MLVPEAYGFKSIKWLKRIVPHQRLPGERHAEKNNDPQSPMKTLARLDVHAPRAYRKGEPVTMRGIATVGASGLARVEYWLRKDHGTHGVLDPEDPAWPGAEWKEAEIPTEPPERLGEGLSGGKFPEGAFHLDPATGRPGVWPLPFSWVPWTVRLGVLEPWSYDLRVRAVDLNGFAQPEPGPNGQSGIADVPCMTFVVG
jgi:hypothetical protein